MRLLIVDDNLPLAKITAELLRRCDRTAPCLEQISLAGDLETAIRLLPGHDAVLCDGEFPVSQNSPPLQEQWDVVRYEAVQRGMHFVLHSGCPQAIDHARRNSVPAITKPASAEDVYAALTERKTHSQPQKPAIRAVGEKLPLRRVL